MLRLSTGQRLRLAGLFVFALSVAGCSGSIVGHGSPADSTASGPGLRVFDSDDMNHDIAGQYLDKFGDRIEVRCPSGQEVIPGRSFRCTIVGMTQWIEVRITSDSGDYTWRVKG